MPQLIIEFRHPNENPYKWRNIRVTNKVGEVTSLWGGSANVWDEVGFASKVPKEAHFDDEVKVYVLNGSSDLPLYIDNLTVTVLRKPE